MTLDNPEFQPDDGSALLHAGRIVPIYRLTAGVAVASLRRAVRGALDASAAAFPEYLPGRLREEMGLGGIRETLEEAHYPTTFEKRDEALRRLAFDELLALQLGMVGRRRARVGEHGRPVAVDDATDVSIREAIVASLRRKVGREVDLTPDQAAAVRAIRDDIARPVPMLRLQAQRSEEVGERPLVLAGQEVGRGQERPLPAAERDRGEGPGRDRRLARADIALEEAKHRRGASDVPSDVPDGAVLVRRQ